jgi:hypothetical protein
MSNTTIYLITGSNRGTPVSPLSAENTSLY